MAVFILSETGDHDEICFMRVDLKNQLGLSSSYHEQVVFGLQEFTQLPEEFICWTSKLGKLGPLGNRFASAFPLLLMVRHLVPQLVHLTKRLSHFAG